MKAFVTGGSGFLGGRIIRTLKRRGHQVRALARSERAVQAVGEAGAEPVEGDLTSVEALRAGMSGCELVIHAAARVKGKLRAEFIEDNVRGTENVLEACRTAGVKRLVHVSTEAVLLGGDPLVRVDETRPRPERGLGPYSDTKARAEAQVLACNGAGLETVVVRPRFIWGAGDTSVLPQLVEAVKSGKFVWVGGGRHQSSVCHVENAAEGTVLAAEKGTPGAVYFLTDGEPVEFRAFVSELLEAAGVKPPRRSAPGWLLQPVAFAVEALWTATAPGAVAPVLREQLALIGEEVTVDDSKARRELGYAPAVTRAEGMAELRREQERRRAG